jgi:Mg-chelatase subunit ChlI
MTRRLSLITAALATALTLTAVAGATQPSQTNEKNAAKYCKALRASAGKDNFKAMFGGKKNAYGKCVSRAAKKDQKQEQTAKTNAAQQCKAEQGQDPQAFSQKYGTNKNGKNAYGKCVSQHAKQNKAAADQTDQNDVDAAKECRAEQSQDPQAFSQKYGTNANKKNAFGKCVSQKSDQKDEQGTGGSGTS